MTAHARQYIFEFPKREKLTRDSFIVAPCNHAAYELIVSWPSWKVPFLALYGEPKCGKSHLARIWAKHAQAIQITAETLQETLSAGQEDHQAYWLDMEDSHARFKNDDQAQEALFHLYNQIIAAGNSTMLITASTPPAHWHVSLQDLQSRLNAIPAIALLHPDDDLLRKLLHKLCADRQIMMGDEICEFLLKRMERSFDAAYQLCDALDKSTFQKKQGMSLSHARDVLLRLNLSSHES